MPKKSPVKQRRSSPAKKKGDDFESLIAEVRNLVSFARHTAASAVNVLQVRTNFEIGRRIVEHEQKGEKRAGYGDILVRRLSVKLAAEFGRGFSKRNLDYMKQFYLDYADRAPAIVQTPSAQSIDAIPSPPSTKRIVQTASAQLAPGKAYGAGRKQIPQMLSAELGPRRIGQTVSDQSLVATSSLPHGKRIVQTGSAKFKNPFSLSWSHYVLLLTIKDRNERQFYEIESASEGWSLQELKRQVASGLYERLALSRDKNSVRKLATQGQAIERPEDILKEPYILEFLGLDEKAGYSESDLETAIINQLERFLLELGKGFLFEGRQRRFTFDDEHYFVDLVFYNRLLRCYVLIDLKLDKLTHQDLGQMQMYVNYFDREVKLQEENRTVGILLCKRKNEAIVKLTLPPDANIHAKEYRLYLPSKELLQQKLIDWSKG